MMNDALHKKHTESPLDSLVRRTSSKRAGAPPRLQQFAADEHFQQLSSPAGPFQGNLCQPLHSPLLHGRFARDSVATASSYEGNSYIEYGNTTRTYSFVSSSDVYPDSELDHRYNYDNAYEDSVYSQPDVTLRDSWHSTATTSTAKPDPRRFTIEGMHDRQPWNDLQHSAPPIPPTVVISAPDHLDDTGQYRTAGRAPVVKPVSTNFSRPVRPPAQEMEEQKRRVLIRNSARQKSQSPSRIARERSPLRQEYSGNAQTHSMSDVHAPEKTFYTHETAPSTTVPNIPQPPHMASTAPRSGLPMNLSASRGDALRQNGSSQGAFNRTESPISLYSNYSYYQYNGIAPSPVGSTFSNSTDPFASNPRSSPRPNASQTSPSNSFQSSPNAPSSSQAAQDYLQLGIQHHEANRLKESALCFEKSAKDGGGCGVGMLMWGLTLRHGWGCEKNEKVGFKWLRKAAESAVEDLESTRTKGGVDTTAVQTELVLAIYEVGQCFFQGWGVPKDQKMAVSYYTVAAQLGDADAQTDLAFCLANGKGCKKDKREAAKWYRAAVKQGQSDVGLAWIWKEKYK